MRPKDSNFQIGFYKDPGVSGKGFLAPGSGKGNWKSHSRFTGTERELENATGREGKFEACIPGNHGKREFPLTPVMEVDKMAVEVADLEIEMDGVLVMEVDKLADEVTDI